MVTKYDPKVETARQRALEMEMHPADPQTERALLSSILIEPDAIHQVSTFVKAEDFDDVLHQRIYQTLADMMSEGRKIDMVTLFDEMRRRDTVYFQEENVAAYLTELAGIFEARHQHIEHYAKSIEADALRRKGIVNLAGLFKDLYNRSIPIQDISGQLQQIALDLLPKSDRTYQSIKEIVGEILDRQEEIAQEGRQPGLSTGLEDLDSMIGGMQPGDMLVLAGRPGMGKTALATGIIMANARAGNAVDLFTLEMSKQQMGGRILSGESTNLERSFTVGQIRQGTIYHEGMMSEFLEAIENVSYLPIYIDDTPAITPNELLAKAKRMQMDHDTKLIVVDYLQLMDSGLFSKAGRTEQVSHISQTIKRVAKLLNVPVLVLSQLNRGLETRKDKRPLLSDLRDSGAIEQDADSVLFIYRDELYESDSDFKGFAEIILSKSRHGPTSMRYLKFNARTASFSDGHDQVRTVILDVNDY